MINHIEDRYLAIMDNHKAFNRAVKVVYIKYRGDKAERLKREISRLEEQKFAKERELKKLQNLNTKQGKQNAAIYRN